MAPRLLRTQTVSFVVFVSLSLLLFREPLSDLISLSWSDERYTHTVLMPFLSLGLICLLRRRIFLHAQYCPRVGIPLVAVAAALFFLISRWTPHLWPPLAPSLVVFSIAFVWMSGFVLCFGTRAFQAAHFPFFLLLLTIPVPPTLVEIAEISLQRATAEATAVLFHLTAVPVFREGMQFSLPGVTIEVARACSGIRSSIALLIAALVLSHLLLQSTWRKAIVIILAIPIAIFKNAFRIAALSWLSVYVSKDFLFGELHHRGGPVFFLLSFALLVPLLLGLQKSEAGSTNRRERSSNSAHVHPQSSD